MSDTLQQLQQLIVAKFGIDAELLTAERPMSEFGLDSLSLIELLFSIEEELGITIPEERSQVNNLGELAALVDALRAEEQAA